MKLTWPHLTVLTLAILMGAGTSLAIWLDNPMWLILSAVALAILLAG